MARTSRSELTRQRILDAAGALFAERGYQATTVGDIEQAAGLAPRAGTLYQHFRGKEEVLRACVERQVEELERMQDTVDMLPLQDLRADLRLIARWNLDVLSRRQPLYRFVWKEGERFPDLRDRVGEAIVEKPLRRVAELIRGLARESGVAEVDCEALALVLAQSMSSYRSLQTIYGRAPLGVDDDRFLEAWVDAAVGALERLGIDVGTAKLSGTR